MPLHQPPGVVRIRLEVGDSRHLAEGEFVGCDRLVRGQLERIGAHRWRFARAEPVGHAADVAEFLHGFPGVEAAGHLQHRPLAHAEDNEVRL